MNLTEYIDRIVSQVINESIGEGGIFTVTGQNDNGEFEHNYEYTPTQNKKRGRRKKGEEEKNRLGLNPSDLYLDFSQYGNKMPGNNTWTEVPQNYQFDQSKAIKKSANNIANSNPESNDIISYDGKYYMPTVKSLGQGDFVKAPTENDWSETLTTPYGPIQCYNLSILGRQNPMIMAHYYKGKPITAGKFNLVARDMSQLPGGIKSYLGDCMKLIQSTPNLVNFNPNYIIYPESSSSFNGQIAYMLKRFVYPSATILGNEGEQDNRIMKSNDWKFRYKGMYDFVKDSVEKLKFDSPTANSDSICSVLSSEVAQIIARQIKIQVANYYKDNYQQIANNTISRSDVGEWVYSRIKSTITAERTKLYNALKYEGIDYNNNQYLDARYLYVLVCRYVFDSSVARYSEGQRFQQNRQGQYFVSPNAINSAILNGLIWLDVDKTIKQYGTNSQSVSNLSSVQRYALTGQFSGSKALEGQDNSNVRVVIVDDNYGSGVTMKNCALSLYKQGVKLKNIVCITPGDLLNVGSGKGKDDLPLNSAEAQTFNRYLRGDYSDLSQNDIDTFEKMKGGSLYKTMNKGVYKQPGHLLRQNIFNGFYPQKKKNNNQRIAECVNMVVKNYLKNFSQNNNNLL